MSTLSLNFNVTLVLAANELTLIRSALGGRMKEEQFAAAKCLDNMLAEQLIGQFRNKSGEIEKLANNLKVNM